jgi:hypothetical protein
LQPIAAFGEAVLVLWMELLKLRSHLGIKR